MGKHNGKSRVAKGSAAKPGAALTSKSRAVRWREREKRDPHWLGAAGACVSSGPAPWTPHPPPHAHAHTARGEGGVHRQHLPQHASRRSRPSPSTFFFSLSRQLSRSGRGGGGAANAHLHTTDPGGGPGMQSVLEAGDLEELMAMVRQRQGQRWTGRGGRGTASGGETWGTGRRPRLAPLSPKNLPGRARLAPHSRRPCSLFLPLSTAPPPHPTPHP